MGFFAEKRDMEKQEFEKVNSQVDILPTVLNLFGVAYEEEYFIGNDILSENYAGYVFFSDYSWYDGNVYVENGEVVNGAGADASYVVDMNKKIHDMIQKNDLILKYDYFRRIKE